MSRPKNPPPRAQHSRHEVQRDDDDDEQSPQLQCHLWARDLRILLDDEKGCVLFETFLREEECDLSELYFVYACRGLRLEREPTKRDRYAWAIYKNYLKGATVRAVPDNVKSVIRERLEQTDIVPELFDEAVRRVIENMMKTTFARFIQSDVYIHHVQRVETFGENADSTPPTDNDHSEDLDSSKSTAPANSDSEEDVEDFSPSAVVKGSNDNSSPRQSRSFDMKNNDNNNDKFFANQMPTLDEDEELKNSTLLPPRTSGNRKPGHVGAPPPRPPQSAMYLLQLQKRQSEIGLSYCEQISKPGFRQPPNPYHVNNSCYVPPSAYHSDIQSMSSGNYTDLDTEGKRKEHYRRHPNEIDRRKPQREIVNSRDHQSNPIPRTQFPVVHDENSHLVHDNPREFHRILCEKLQKVLGETTEDEVHNQSILDNHVQRVFKTPPTQTPRAPSPPLERQLFAKVGLKSPYQMMPGLLRNVSNNRHNDIDSAIYTCGSGLSSTTPMAPPRGRSSYPVFDSGCDESVLTAPAYNENVREWFNRTSQGPSTSKGKNKASVCSGSNRSSKSGQDGKKRNQASNKESEVVVGYHYEGDTHPFVIRLPQKNLRLKDFKAHLTRKGAFRYFFKCPMDDFGANGVYEEVKDDNQLLPLWDGKVYSEIIPAEHSNSTRVAPEITM